MLEFPEGYFREEVRDGFAISSMMKRAWAAQLEILQKITDICSRHGFTYYAYWGTLLGAVRHKGFIPWDDDMDIALKREDYLGLLEAAKEELPAEFCILSCYTEEEWDNSFMRITNGHTIDLSEQRLSQYHGFPYVAGIDIYPLDYVPRNAQAAEIQKALLSLTGNMASLSDFVQGQKAAGVPEEELAESVRALEEGLSALEECFGTVIDRKRNIKNQLQKLYDHVCMMHGEKDADIITNFPNYMMRYAYCVEKEWLAHTIQMPFENIMITVPQGYDEILKLTYHDYMVPVNCRAAHDYPFYKDQAKMLGQGEGRQATHGDLEETAAGRKTILYHVSIQYFLEYPVRTVAKMKSVLQVFQKNPAVRLWWRPFALDESMTAYARKYFPEEYAEYREITENYRTRGRGVFDDTADIERAIRCSDAYYGDEDDLFEQYRETGKPIMVQNYDIMEY